MPPFHLTPLLFDRAVQPFPLQSALWRRRLWQKILCLSCDFWLQPHAWQCLPFMRWLLLPITPKCQNWYQGQSHGRVQAYLTKSDSAQETWKVSQFFLGLQQGWHPFTCQRFLCTVFWSLSLKFEAHFIPKVGSFSANYPCVLWETLGSRNVCTLR